jgi:YidC/Oxa1 family membrane protein insertase
MEHVRLLLAIGLSFLVLFVWSIFFVDRQAVTDRPAPLEMEKLASEEQLPPAAEDSIRGPAGQDLGDVVGASQSNEKPLRNVTVETPLYIVQFSSKGASLQSFILKNYRESVDPDAAFKELVSAGLTNGVIRISLADSSLAGLDDAVFSIDQNIDRLPVRGSKQSLNFQWVSEDGVVFIKTYSFDPDSYLIDLTVTIKNNSNRYLKDQLVLSVRNGIGDDTGYAFVGPSALINNKLEQIKTKKINDQAEYTGNIKWIGIEDRYFISSIIPGNEVSGVVKLGIENKLVENQLVNPVFELSPGEWTSSEFHLFMGPKSMQVLKNLGHDFDKALNFGFLILSLSRVYGS